MINVDCCFQRCRRWRHFLIDLSRFGYNVIGLRHQFFAQGGGNYQYYSVKLGNRNYQVVSRQINRVCSVQESVSIEFGLVALSMA